MRLIATAEDDRLAGGDAALEPPAGGSWCNEESRLNPCPELVEGRRVLRQAQHPNFLTPISSCTCVPRGPARWRTLADLDP